MSNGFHFYFLLDLVYSQKSSKEESPPRNTGTDPGTEIGTEAGTGSTETESEGVMLADDAWLASLATADARRATLQHEIAFIATVILLAFLLL